MLSPDSVADVAHIADVADARLPARSAALEQKDSLHQRLEKVNAFLKTTLKTVQEDADKFEQQSKEWERLYFESEQKLKSALAEKQDFGVGKRKVDRGKPHGENGSGSREEEVGCHPRLLSHNVLRGIKKKLQILFFFHRYYYFSTPTLSPPNGSADLACLG